MARFAAEALDLTFRPCAVARRNRSGRAAPARRDSRRPRSGTRSRTLIDRRHVLLPAVATFVKRHVARADRRGRGRSVSRRRARHRRAARHAGGGPSMARSAPRSSTGSRPNLAQALDAGPGPSRRASGSSRSGCATTSPRPRHTALAGRAESTSRSSRRVEARRLHDQPSRRLAPHLQACLRSLRRGRRRPARAGAAARPRHRAGHLRDDSSRSTRSSILPACSIGPSRCSRARRSSRAAA